MNFPMQKEYQKLCESFDRQSAERAKNAAAENKTIIQRTGLGVDVHAYGDINKPCMLGCVKWENTRGIEGHSDGDVIAHAICDSILSACRLGDLGLVFGVDKTEMKNASGKSMLETTLKLAHENQWNIENISVQLVAKTPKITPKQYEVAYELTKIIKAPVSFSATTTDGLGFTGRGEGLGAISTVLVSKSI